MQYSKEFMKKNAIYPKISFKDKKPHTVELVKDKIESITTTEGEKEGVRFLVKEDGELKSFFTGSSALISMLSSFEPGDIVTIEMKSKNISGQLKSVYSVNKEGEAEGDVEDEDKSNGEVMEV